MGDSLRYLRSDEVDSPKTFAVFCQQRLGIPGPNGKEIAVLTKRAKEFFDQNPRASWGTMVRTVEWCRNRNRRVAHSYAMFAMVRYAWSDKYLPELDPQPEVDELLERRIVSALKVEKDSRWRDKLLGAQGIEARRGIYEAWYRERGERGGGNERVSVSDSVQGVLELS